MKLLNYYNESRTRAKGREKILSNCSNYFKETPAEVVTMKELANYLEIERRTLYHYYNNKTDLIVDVSLFNAEKYLDWQNETNSIFLEKYKNDTIKFRLMAYFKHFMVTFIEQKETIKIVSEYDRLINSLDTNSQTYDRYLQISNELRNNTNIGLDIVEEGIKNGLIHTRGYSAKQISTILDQSFRAYFFKSLASMERTEQYSIQNVEDYLEIMLDGICL